MFSSSYNTMKLEYKILIGLSYREDKSRVSGLTVSKELVKYIKVIKSRAYPTLAYFQLKQWHKKRDHFKEIDVISTNLGVVPGTGNGQRSLLLDDPIQLGGDSDGFLSRNLRIYLPQVPPPLLRETSHQI